MIMNENLIEIKNIRLTKELEVRRLSADILMDGRSYNLWYSVSEKYAEGLCSERSDAFVAGLLLYAIKNNYNISFSTPLTAELKDSLENDFIEAVCQKNPMAHRVQLVGPVAETIKKIKTVRATGISCGVDSLYTVCRRFIKHSISGADHYLVINNLHGATHDESPEACKWRFEYLVRNATSFSNETKIPLIVGDTNYVNSGIPGLSFENFASFGNLFCVLAMQNLYSHYYVSSAGSVDEFGYYLRQGVFATNTENLDLLTMPSFSTLGLKVTVDGLAERTEKVRYISSFPAVQRHLDVCHVHKVGSTRNGTNDCPKCMRTVLELMLLGEDVLNRFGQVFDLDYVKTHRHEYLAEMMRGMLHKSLFAQQCWHARSKMGFSYSDYVRAYWIVAKKVFAKMLRGGRTAQNFSSK